jgi:hypothetical protein
MRIKRMAALGVATGALVLSGGLAVAQADSTGGSTDSTAPFTTTAPGEDGPDRGERVRHMVVNGEPLSDEQRACMEENGAVPPGKPGERPTRDDMEAHRATMEAAMDECGIERPEPGERGVPGDRGEPGEGRVTHMMVNGEELSDEQRACMEENAPPPPFEPGERPSRENFEEHRAAMEAAMDECGVSRPEPGEGGEAGFAFRTERGGPAGAGVEEFGWAEAGPANA